MSRILISSGTWHAALCCVESLGRRGHEVHVMAQSWLTPASASRYCARRIATPSEYDGQAFLDVLFHTLATGHYDLFIPISDRVIEIASAHRDTIGWHTTITLASPEAIQTARDKTASMKLAEEMSVPSPRTLYPNTVEAFADAARQLGFPCVVKMPRSSGSKGILIAADEAAVTDFVQVNGRPDNWPILQEYRPGATADLATVCDKGQIIAAHAFFCEARHMIGGTPPYVKSLLDPRIVENAQRIAKTLDWSGALDFDFTLTDEGECLLLELNPRLSGTISFAYAVGIDLPKAMLDIAKGNPAPAYGTPPPDHTRFRTGLQYELHWWIGDPIGRTCELIGTWLNPKVLYLTRWSDPALLAAQVYLGLKNGYDSRK